MLFPDSAADRQRLDRAFQYEFAAPHITSEAAIINNPVAYDRYLNTYISSEEQIIQAIQKLGHDLTLAGAILTMTVGTDPKIASLNLTYQSIANAYNNKTVGVSPRKLETIWPAYRTVAHFWAAHQVWIDKITKRDFEILEGFPCHPSQVLDFLSLAEYFRRKGEKFKLPRDRRGGHLLDKKQTWKVYPASRIPKTTDTNIVFSPNYPFTSPILEKRRIYKGI